MITSSAQKHVACLLIRCQFVNEAHAIAGEEMQLHGNENDSCAQLRLRARVTARCTLN